jgi:hypothetical protein
MIAAAGVEIEAIAAVDQKGAVPKAVAASGAVLPEEVFRVVVSLGVATRPAAVFAVGRQERRAASRQSTCCGDLTKTAMA